MMEQSPFLGRIENPIQLQSCLGKYQCEKLSHLQERLIGLLGVQCQRVQEDVGQTRTDPATHLIFMARRHQGGE